jgi:hypothetical protein
MSDRPAGNGKWLVIGLLALGVVLALVGVKYRQFPESREPTTRPSVDEKRPHGGG